LECCGNYLNLTEFSPDSSRLITQSWDGSLMLWELGLHDGVSECSVLAVEELGYREASYRRAVFASDGSNFVLISENGHLKKFNIVPSEDEEESPPSEDEKESPPSEGSEQQDHSSPEEEELDPEADGHPPDKTVDDEGDQAEEGEGEGEGEGDGNGDEDGSLEDEDQEDGGEEEEEEEESEGDYLMILAPVPEDEISYEHPIPPYRCSGNGSEWVVDQRDRRIFWIPPERRDFPYSHYGHRIFCGTNVGGLLTLDLAPTLDLIEV